MIKSGPMSKRKCTDMFCLFIFLVTCGGMGYITNYTMNNGDPSKIMAPVDADGIFCGKANQTLSNGTVADLTQYPLLYWQTINSITNLWQPYAVCIKACPASTDLVVPCVGTTNVQPDANGDCTPQPAPFPTINFLNKYCVPDLTYLVNSGTMGNSSAVYNNVIFGLGLDNIQ